MASAPATSPSPRARPTPSGPAPVPSAGPFRSSSARPGRANLRTSFEARQPRATPMPQLTILYWRDIPSQVVASAGRRNQAKVMLPDRFQEAIDRAAMRGGARDADGYLHEWRRAEPVGCGAELPAEAEAAARRQTGRASCGERVGQYG